MGRAAKLQSLFETAMTDFTEQLRTDWYAPLDRAEDELRELARQHGCDMVINVTKEKDTESEPTEKGGTYYYTVWCLAGEAVIR